MGEDIRAIRTKERLRNALLSLMKERELADIKVTEIVKTAGLARKTFYAHYADINDLAYDCFLTQIGGTDFRIASCKTPFELSMTVVESFERNLLFCRENTAFAKLIHREAFYSRYLSSISHARAIPMSRSIEDIQPLTDNPIGQRLFSVDLVSRLYVLATGFVICNWIEEGMIEPVGVVACRGAYLTFHLSDIYSATTGACAELKRFVLQRVKEIECECDRPACKASRSESRALQVMETSCSTEGAMRP